MIHPTGDGSATSGGVDIAVGGRGDSGTVATVGAGCDGGKGGIVS